MNARETGVDGGRKTRARALLTEVGVAREWLSLKTSRVYYGLGVPRGNGEPVIVVPGLLASDLALTEMHLWLGRLGYRSYRSGVGVHADCPDALLEPLLATIARAHEETGERVRLIGHSLGGLLARAAAGLDPDRVAQVVMMGTPARRLRAHPLIARLARTVLRRSRRRAERPCMAMFKNGLRQCLPDSVDRVAVFSRSDPVVDARDAAGADNPRLIAVKGTHLGMPVNREVYRAVAGVLAEPERARVPSRRSRAASVA